MSLFPKKVEYHFKILDHVLEKQNYLILIHFVSTKQDFLYPFTILRKTRTNICQWGQKNQHNYVSEPLTDIFVLFYT